MWREYEERKRQLQALNLPPEEYEKRIQEIIKELENGTADNRTN